MLNRLNLNCVRMNRLPLGNIVRNEAEKLFLLIEIINPLFLTK